ncbi:DUF559 domain-containing protein [Papillibacter cinnamivorans]|uniref:DUF559 domain-containing protein n=1 Tax=Papillibacter cinnamivorans DSM 12816 TaxID=1122930 RepID=A0A1W1YZU2_9FIRM|nr:DUF559 domain-containing protein [Papillibacter cinnamivorans]SMC41218.1 Protein of unknown function [Papillibacter cinnamivorans DSM 12816]
MENFYAITDEQYCTEDFNIHEHLTERVNFSLNGNTADFKVGQYEALIKCKGEGEQLLSMEIDRLGIESIDKFNPLIEVLGFTRQAEILVCGQKYNVAFLIEVAYKQPDYREVNYVIECDQSDCKRENVHENYLKTRQLQKYGYEVIRFTEEEIFFSPYKCAHDVLAVIVRNLKIQGGK